ncbi:MAG: hypothetical protein NTX64_16970 [Elusimicrobia bacterium]|nr:hypothetical protein [Elusimicrobiota bacterium]
MPVFVMTFGFDNSWAWPSVSMSLRMVDSWLVLWKSLIRMMPGTGIGIFSE